MTIEDKRSALTDYCLSHEGCETCGLWDNEDGFRCIGLHTDEQVDKVFDYLVKNDPKFMVGTTVSTHDPWSIVNPSTPEEIIELGKAMKEGFDAGFKGSTTDVVNHPGHYESGQFECIDVMEETQGTEAVLGFCICNAFKYLYRHNRKNGIEDVKKARWYIDKYISIMERDLLMADRLEDK